MRALRRPISWRVTYDAYEATETTPEKGLVLFSGGQDSTTCLAWALARFAAVETIGFDYGQRHRIELDCRTAVLERLRREFPQWDCKLADDHIVDLGVLGQVSDTALTRETAISLTQSGLPNNSGYPDCRDDTLKALQATLSLGMDHRFVIHTPLMWRDKRATWELAQRLGGPALVELVREETHSCYRGDRVHLHSWGYGCGDCPACGLRRAGWEAFSASTPSAQAGAD